MLTCGDKPTDNYHLTQYFTSKYIVFFLLPVAIRLAYQLACGYSRASSKMKSLMEMAKRRVNIGQKRGSKSMLNLLMCHISFIK